MAKQSADDLARLVAQIAEAARHAPSKHKGNGQLRGHTGQQVAKRRAAFKMAQAARGNGFLQVPPSGRKFR